MPSTPPRPPYWKQLLLDLSPASPGITPLECARIMAGMALAICITALTSQWVAHDQLEMFWQGASISATAFILFALPSSPFAQPWAILVGNLSAAAIGMGCTYVFSNTVVAATIALPLSVLAMMQLRAVHPPATAVALYMVLKHVHAPEILLFPLGFNLVVLVAVGTAYNRLTGRRYPYRQLASSAPASGRGQVSQSDVDQALARYNEVLAISRDDLTSLLQVASGAAYQRHLGDLLCADAMITNVRCAPADAPLDDLRTLLGQGKHRELPVVDKHNRLLGTIGLEQWFDVLHNTVSTTTPNTSDRDDSAPASEESQPTLKPATQTGWSKKILSIVGLARLGNSRADQTPSAAAPQEPSLHNAMQPQRVRDVMVPSLVIAHPQQPLMEIIPILCQGGRYHVPVVDDAQHLQGIITQTDLLRALDRALPSPQAQGASAVVANGAPPV
ncbi:CBS domain-containing protein [Lampropedia puyangensis]|uniref:CBS domain-containing protein n=1 Tax=Lampropedia puyangensis TaxID=1330072 RepID=A0A4S8F6P9_9BURK|nr:HPP family protein [Lampropedia puyangensis]THU02779.1 CBS domain-containing protein [Lampropedia puyangensis]